MNKDEARRVQATRFAELKAVSYHELVESFIDHEPETEEMTSPSGRSYQVERVDLTRPAALLDR